MQDSHQNKKKIKKRNHKGLQINNLENIIKTM